MSLNKNLFFCIIILVKIMKCLLENLFLLDLSINVQIALLLFVIIAIVALIIILTIIKKAKK